MKILYLTDQLYLHGGAEKILASKINALVEAGFEVILVTCEQKTHPFVYRLASAVKHIDLKINYDREKSYFSPVNVLKALSHFRLLNEVLKVVRPEVIVSVGFTPDQYFINYINRRIPTVKEIHFSGHILKNQKGIFSTKNLMDFFFGKFSRVVVLNKDEKNYYPNFKTEIIPNFVEILTDKVEGFPRTNTVVAAGRIAPVKQFDHLIRAWALIADKLPDWKLIIYGNGEEHSERKLKEMVKELGLEQSIEMPGPTLELTDKMKEAKIFAMSSATECFPMVLLEAQATGLAIVSYDCPHGPSNIVNHHIDGILSEDQDIERLAAEIYALAADEHRLSSYSANAVLNAAHFTKDKIIIRWLELFKKLKYEQVNKS